MNKRIFILILSLLIVIVLVTAKFYFNAKKETLEEYNNYVLLEKKVKEVYELKQKYKLNYSILNSLRKYCDVFNKGDKYLIKCTNLDEKQFNVIQNKIFRNNFKIQNFNIYKDKNMSLSVEIIK